MKYTLKPVSPLKTFEKVKPGEVFKYSGCLYIKTNKIEGKDSCSYNAILLDEGEQTWFGEGYTVTDVGEYEIIHSSTKKA